LRVHTTRLLRSARNDSAIMIDSEGQRQKQKSGIVQFTTFYIGEDLFGINTKQVQEILHYQKITPVSLVPEYVRGLINLRGQIVTVIDLRYLLGLLPLEDETTRMHLVVKSEEEAICLFVDRMNTIVSVKADQLLPPPGTVQGMAAQYIREVCQVDDDLLMILDLKSVLQLQEEE
jgi:purine-binding chemotaxis protein CheW